MNTRNVPSDQMTVGQVLAGFPQTVGVFMTLQTHCVGCHLARFCTLADVARIYGLPLQDLMERVMTSLPSNS